MNLKESSKQTVEEQPRVAVAQIGARMHYAVPRILESAGLLYRFYTDIYADSGALKYFRRFVPRSLMPSSLKSLVDRTVDAVPNRKIESFLFFGLCGAIRGQLHNSLSGKTKEYLRKDRRFGRLVTERLDSKTNVTYAFKGAALEILKWAETRDVLTVVEQPNVHRSVMHRMLAKEREAYPGWSHSDRQDRYAGEEAHREREEWSRADLIICPSNFVKRGIEQSGGPTERTAVVPYGVDFAARSSPREAPSRPLHVLTVGTIGLRKGAPYLMRAARNSEATFRAVGTVDLSDHGKKELARHVDLRGQVPRSEVHRHYEWADVFLLPSLCEGSATVVYEALSCALPVICTPNTGSIVRDDQEGFLVPIRDARAIVDRIEQLTRDPVLYEQISLRALRRYEQDGSLKAYGRRLVNAIEGLVQ
jgi:glycosyltransferase involved in cell wall biosynthesis